MSFNVKETLRLRLKEGVAGTLTEGYYTITGEVTIQELINFGVPVYSNVYSQFGYSEEDYDVISRNSIVYTLNSVEGTSVTVPAEVLEEVTEDPLVAYESKALVVSLGEHPNYREFIALQQYVTDVVSEYIGVVPSVSLITTSDPIRVTEERHTYLTALRERTQSTIRTPSRRLIQRETELELLTQENIGLRKFIQEYLASCATDCTATPVDEPNEPVTLTEIDKAQFNFGFDARNQMRNPCGM